MTNDYVISYPVLTHPTLKANMYGLWRKKASEFATSMHRELAEGPTQYLPNNFYGPVELWPLVMEV